MLFISLILLSQKSFALICVNNSSNYKMFASVLRSGALARGHELAFQDSGFSEHREFSSETDADLAKQIENMSSGTCSVVLGLFTSRECLIAGPIFMKNKLIGISSSCGHNKIEEFSPYLYTIIPPISEFIAKIAVYLNQKIDAGNIIAIYQPTDVYSETEFYNFKKQFTKQIIEIPVGSDGQFDINKFSKLRGKKSTIVFFTYTLPSAKILMDLSEHQLINKNTNIIGSSCWTFDVSVFRPIRSILEKANSVIATDIIDWKKAINSRFVQGFMRKYDRNPLAIEILTYDVTNLAINCYKKSVINHKYDITSFQNCMTKTQYDGVSGHFSFNNNSSFANRPIYLTNFLKRL